jgi:cytochrome-b5 reductase
MNENQGKRLPRPPREPDPEDCCGSGCEPCVFEIYQERLERWRERCRALRRHEVDDD